MSRKSISRNLDQINGENHRSAKLTWDKVREIRSLYPAQGYKLLGRLYNVTPGAIRDIVLRKTWKE